MSVIDVLARVDAIRKKYEKYDTDRLKEGKDALYTNDSFLRLYTEMERNILAAEQKTMEIHLERNRAVVAATTAELRRAKAMLQEEIPKLEKLSQRKLRGVPAEDLSARGDMVREVSRRIEVIGESTGGSPWRTGGRNKRVDTRTGAISPDDIEAHPDHWMESTESRGFRSEFESRKTNQDKTMDVISAGLVSLKNLAHEMNEEMDRQLPLAEEIENKMTSTTTDLRNNNRRLKEVLDHVRTTRKFMIDTILVCILLGIGAYIYDILKK